MTQANLWPHPPAEWQTHPLMNQGDPRCLKKFVLHNAEHPAIYEEFEKLALQVKASGRTRYSQWIIANVIRWHRDLGVSKGDFKISNDFIAYYVRLLMIRHPEFADFFSIKTMKRRRRTMPGKFQLAEAPRDGLE